MFIREYIWQTKAKFLNFTIKTSIFWDWRHRCILLRHHWIHTIIWASRDATISNKKVQDFHQTWSIFDIYFILFIFFLKRTGIVDMYFSDIWTSNSQQLIISLWRLCILSWTTTIFLPAAGPINEIPFISEMHSFMLHLVLLLLFYCVMWSAVVRWFQYEIKTLAYHSITCFSFCFSLATFSGSINPLNPAGRFSGLRK